MDTADIKLDIFKRLDNLKDSRLKKIYGALLNLLNDDATIDEWAHYSEEQKKAINKGIE